VWLTLAHVTEVGFDEDHGVFADVRFADGTEETVSVNALCASDRAGSYRPVKVDELLLIAVPMGDPGYGPWVVARAWNGADRPPAAVGTGQDPTDNWVDIVEPGKHYILRTSDDGQVQLQDASQSFVRGDDLADAADSFLDALSTFVRSISDTAAPAAPNAALTVATVIAAAAVFQPAITQFKNARQTYLSTKIKGE
jgi:hypothetical protein